MARTDKDFAVEFGGYLADSAEQFMAVLNKTRAFANVPQDQYIDHWRGLQSAIYEFRKRADKVMP